MLGKRIGQGRTADVWEYGEGRIVKLYYEETPVQGIDWEYAAGRYAFEGGVRTPKPAERLTLDGREGIVFDRVHAPTLLKRIGEQPLRIKAFAGQLAGLQFSLNQLECGNDIPDLKEHLRWRISAAPMLTTGEKSDVLAALERLPAGNRLLHGDFHPDNVLADEPPWIIDWMNAARGTPAADAARTLLLLEMGAMPPGTPLPVKVVTGIVRKRLATQYLRAYLRLSGLSSSDIGAWIVPVAAARLYEGIPLAEKENLAREVRRRLGKRQHN
ncbi:aminoglycoside phosphotransferase family protein [Paenibacillus sp. NFR01]|uniref:aminoglycoside phosphotransferase family protein n=1 Tax=Paenibacillus sp. NFR01 TaxID=1566279 RepID=UPI0008B9E7BD|nr:aminoglycoside phosphotransferase family protein [Paenibacillus sp. NFR01]SEU29468.1 Phosphotransferase enzyme family protein [Paenibacillus sp. NFR01]